VKIGAEGKETYVYRGDVANAAIRLAGLELGLFTEKTQIAHDVHDMTEEEVLEAIVKEGQELLAQRRSDKAKVINRDS